jgi:transporter family-2 protein
LWAVLPGLLGSFFVFAGIVGYQRVGAATTIGVLVASQLVAGLAADAFKSGAAPMRPSVVTLAGAALLILGAFLVARERV